MCRTVRPDQPVKFGVDYETVDTGFIYSYSDLVTIGLMVKNAYRLSRPDGFHSGIEEVDPDYSFKLPRYATLGFSYQKNGLLWSVDNETIFGEYGGTGHKKAEFWIIRSGIEKKIMGTFSLRAGVIIPVIARTSTTGDLRKHIPFPKMGGTFGVGLHLRNCNVDIAFFGDPGRSYADQKPVIGCLSSVTLKI